MNKIFGLFEDEMFLRNIYAFAFNRTNNSYDAEDLSSEIILQVLKASNRNSDITNPVAFVWIIAKRTYADFCEKRKRNHNAIISDEYDDDVQSLADNSNTDDILDEDAEKVSSIMREIAFLSKIYREVCIMYYLEDKKIGEIAKALQIKETTVKQRLFSARSTIKKGVEYMETKYPTLKPIDISYIGTGNPFENDPITVAQRTLSKNLVYLCKDTVRSTKELSDLLNVPMPFIEEEVEIQLKGQSGYYGLLRETDNKKYISNFIMVDYDDYMMVNEMFKKNTDVISKRFDSYLKSNEKKILALPFLNNEISLELIAWALVSKVNWWFESKITNTLRQKYFSNIERTKRDFFTFGIATTPNQNLHIGFYGCDGISALDVAGYRQIFMSNIYGKRIKAHFHCDHNISIDSKLLLMLKSIGGLAISGLSKEEQEIASNAIEVGYIYKDGDMLYPKVLVIENTSVLTDIVNDFIVQTDDLVEGCADELYSYVKKLVPPHLMGEYHIFTEMTACGLLGAMIEKLIELGTLNIPPKLGAEGIIVEVKK